MRQIITRRPDSLFDFMSEVERSFDELWSNRQPATRPTASFTPAVDLHESADFYLVSLDLPGIPEKDIKIDVQDGRLSVSGERSRESRQDDGMFRRFERSHGKFERVFQLPPNVNEAKIQARYENGVLEIMIPKAEVAKPRSVQIESSKGGLFSRLLGQKDVEAKTGENH